MSWSQKYYQEYLSNWVENMEALLKTSVPCSHCPHGAGTNYFIYSCLMCKTFMSTDIADPFCPCQQLGKTEAIAAATLAVEAYHRSHSKEAKHG